MKYSVKIGSAWGIPIELHITFILLMVFVFVFTFPGQLYFFYLILLLFVFVLVHELSHSWVARRYNISVRKIVLYPIGGVSEIEEIPENPRIEWRMAIAGPLSSLVIGAVLFGLAQVFRFETQAIPGIASTDNLLSTLGLLNVLLGAFNLIPAFPMDGGRVFRALLAERMSFSDATKYASYIGRILGILMAVFGIFYNLFLVIIGVFVYIGASEEAEQTIVSTTLARVRVGDVMYSEAQMAKPETTLSEAVEIMLRSKYHDIPIEKDNVLQGIVTWDEITKVKPEQRNTLQLKQLSIKHIWVFADESVLEAYKSMSKERIDLIPVVKRENPDRVVGVVTSEAIAKAYEKAKSLR